MIDISKVLAFGWPGASWSLGETYKSLVWHDKSPKPTKIAIEKKHLELIAYDKTQEYKTLRANEYPPIADQLDKIYHDGIDEWKAEIKIIKDKYPKPE